MKSEIETKKTRLELMNRRLEAIEAEGDSIRKEIQALRASLAQDTPKGLWRQATLTTASILVLTPLLTGSVFHNAQSNATISEQAGGQAITSAESGQIVRAGHPTANNRKPSQTGKKNTLFARAKAASQRQWGPSLLMPETKAKKRYYGFDPLVQQQQKNLLILGFNVGKADGFKGPGTQRAIAEFRALYLPDSGKQLKDADLAIIMENYANLARRDAALFGIDHGIVAAIRLSSVRTGVDFAYLMKLAATESNFEPESEALSSSATGMYQFTRDTWLNTLKTHGAKYGLVADYAGKIEHHVTRSGYERPMVQDKTTYQYLLDLRKSPRLAAIMAAETVRDNQQKLANSFDRKPTETDLYLAHFLGVDDAITFLKSLEQSPDRHADELFPAAARSNYDVFHPKTCAPRTINEVYAHFGERLSRKRYNEQAVSSTLWLATN